MLTLRAALTPSDGRQREQVRQSSVEKGELIAVDAAQAGEEIAKGRNEWKYRNCKKKTRLEQEDRQKNKKPKQKRIQVNRYSKVIIQKTKLTGKEWEKI